MYRPEQTKGLAIVSDNSLDSSYLLYDPKGFRRNFYVVLQTVFVCFVWIWEQTAIFPYTTLTDWFL